MITQEQFDIDIDVLHGKKSVDFYFVEEREISNSYTHLVQYDSQHNETDRYLIKHFLYGRIDIGNDSFFAEVVGYIHPDAPRVISYHIVSILDLTFDKCYSLNYSYSDFSESDKFEYL